MTTRHVLLRRPPHALLLVAAALLGRPGIAAPIPPIALHPENPHYFVWRGAPTILVTSGEHYGALLNLDFDYVPYFDELKSHGLNHTRTFTGVYCEDASAFRITDNTLAPLPNRYLCPWARSDEPGYRGGGDKFDLARWDPAYFDRLRDFMTRARDRGIVVELTLFCPMYKDAMWDLSPMNAVNNVNGIGALPRDEVHTLKHPALLDAQVALTRKIVGELSDFDNLYYEVCNEPYFGGVTMEWQHRIIDTIAEAETDFSSRHLISLNIANGSAKIEAPHPAVSIFNFHYCVPPEAVAVNYALGKVIGENETGFRGRADVLYRTEGWDFLVAGGALYNNLDYSFTARHPAGTFRDYESPGGGSVELRRQLGILKRFLEGFELVRMKPSPEIIRDVAPKNLSASALAEDGKAYALYLHVALPRKPKNLEDHLRKNIEASVSVRLPAGDFACQWVDTKTGQSVREERFQHKGGDRLLPTPLFADDIALRILRRP